MSSPFHRVRSIISTIHPPMDAQRFQRVEQLYHEALEKPAAERSAFLEQACAGDEALRKDVASLIDQSGEGLLDQPAWHAVSRYDSSNDAMDGMDSMIGRQIAHFEIVDRLGEGGMGAVYKARDRHLDRDVALKVLLPEAVGNADR